ncbi:BASS family bile acid:Na+ symporter [Haloactinospora alba]|uniref:BASS family bile acid:Na+ symporter n=1 Tax=Haloactinospora alba TaxID=405555 RepID=A0A543NN31_9ACTN|nr:bile acid:sodium symporter [Haloactinospora alba]TQN33235.1 BASS family bile acid:Na+ symporter [Haloactinospora alba]
MDAPPVTLGLVLLLVATMTTVGTELSPSGFVRLLHRPATLAVALAANLLLLPASAVALVAVLDLDGGVAVGIVLAAAAPGGGTGVLLAHHARADPVLALGIQGILAPLGLVAVPLWARATSQAPTAGLDGGSQLTALLAVQAVPLVGGMFLRARRPEAADRLRTVSRRVADVLLVTMTGYVLVVSAPHLARLPAEAYLAITLLVGASLATVALPRSGGPPERRALAMVTTVRNLSLALLAAGAAAEAQQAAGAVIAYSVLMYLLSGLALIPMRAAQRHRTRAG